MILAGIDEAGYGPLLGPLVVGCCAFEVQQNQQSPPQEPAELGKYGNGGAEAAESAGGAAGGAAKEGEEFPCLWKRLRKHVSKTKVKDVRDGRKIHVNDSKLVYSPSAGLKELERSVLALSATAGVWPDDCHDLLGLLSRTAPHVVGDLGAYPWYESHEGETFPLRQEALPVRLFANALRQEMRRCGAACVHLAARVVCERQLNDMFEKMRNKATALFTVSAFHIDHLLRTYGEQDLTIVCDRQGGRGHYGSLLRLMFEEWSLQIVEETETRSDYVLTRNGHAVRLGFREKAEAKCMPVAVASMLSKYLREALMGRFNAWWRRHLPDLEPTAGYYGDGMRFLQDIDAKRRELGVTDEQLIRSR